MNDKELEITLNDDNTISFSDYINTRIAYETVCQEKDKEIERLNNTIEEYKTANEYHQNIIHELETMKQPNQLHSRKFKLFKRK